MKLSDILLLGLTISLLVIGIDQSIILGLSQAYWAFMLALIPFFIYAYRKIVSPERPDEKPSSPKKRRS
jgi:hypothetical protein